MFKQKMKNISLIVKKDLDKIFKFPRMLFTTILLPGLIIFIVYGIMGSAITTMEENVEAHNSIIYIINEDEEYLKMFKNINNYELKKDNSNTNEIKKYIDEGTVDALIILDEGFTNKINNNERPKVEIYYSQVNTNSMEAYNKILTTLELYKNKVLYDKGIETTIFNITSTKVNDEKSEVGFLLGSLMPMMLIIIIFASSMGVGADAIAGEKERGTLATLLMTPVSRSEILTGKLISTLILVLLSAASSFIGILLTSNSNESLFGNIGELSYAFGDYILLLVTLIIVGLFASLLLLIISTLAKNIKEASALATPIYIIAMICAILSTYQTAEKNTFEYVIPIYNTSLIMKDIFTMNLDINNFLIMVISSIILIVISIIALQKLFKKESVAFTK